MVILGLTGRNFAAGMSGGIAYVYDVDGSFRAKTNAESVELLLLTESKDKQQLKALLEEFYALTGYARFNRMATAFNNLCFS